MEKVGTVILSTNDGKIHWGDKITGEPGSKLRLRLVDQSWVLLGPFKATFERSVVSEKVVGVLRLEQGKARIQIRLGMRATQSIPVVRTPSAVMGVRGTDLMATYDPLLGESEIISFENDIDFQSVQNESHVLVHTGQWGGIGGRFGETIRAPMALPPTIVQHFKDLFVK